jgi:hypothetical protein
MEEIREHVAVRENDPLSLRPDHIDETWAVPSDTPKVLPSTTALAFIKATHPKRCMCLYCAWR